MTIGALCNQKGPPRFNASLYVLFVNKIPTNQPKKRTVIPVIEKLHLASKYKFSMCRAVGKVYIV